MKLSATHWTCNDEEWIEGKWKEIGREVPIQTPKQKTKVLTYSFWNQRENNFKGVLTQLLYARGDAQKIDYKTNKKKGKNCNHLRDQDLETSINLSPAVKRFCHRAEGTTQGDSIAMALYAPNIWPLITSLQVVSTAKQCSFADDAGGIGSSTDIKRWWDTLSTLGPDFGFFPNDKKWWIDAKPGKKEIVKEVFKMTDIIVTMEGRNHLRAVIGSRENQEEFVSEKVSDLVNWRSSSDTVKGMLRRVYLSLA